MRGLRFPRSVLLLALVMTLPVVAAAKERSEVPDKYKWKLTDLFPDDQAWTAAKDKLAADIPSLAAYQGKLGDSASSLYQGLSTYMDLSQRLERIYTYASQTFDQDTRVSRSQEREQEAQDVASKLRTAASFVRPEIIAIGPEKIEKFLAAEPKLADYRPYLENLARWAPHTLSADQERILARAARLAGAPGDVYRIFTSADMPYPTVTLSTGEEVRLDNAAYTKYRAVPNRDDRRMVFQAFFKDYNEYRRTLGTTLADHVQTHLMNRDLRHFDSCLQAALFDDNIPVEVYHQLIADVNANLPTLFRYLKLRQKMLGLPDLGYEDLYAPLVKNVDMTFTPEQAVTEVLDAVKPLGPDYVKTMKYALTEGGWTDWMPTTGKRSGAYSTGAYGVHPYQLLNFNGEYDDVSTLAHESGHSLHTWLASQHQPYVTADYATFVAEVASTLNENLLFHSMLNEAKDDDTRLFLLGNDLETLRTTLFRQVLFAEFELAIHEMAEKGEPLTGDGLNDLYLGLVRKYYGHDQGICRVDSLYGAEWEYIPHFYYNFYVFQYATSLIASTAIANGIRDEMASEGGTTVHRDAYIKMLSSGSSEYPVDLLKDAGVDMTTSAPFQACMKEMNSIMDEMETILARQKK